MPPLLLTLMLALMLTVAGCGRSLPESSAPAPLLQLRQLQWVGDGALRAELSLSLSEAMLTALEEGIALPFLIEWRRCESGCAAVAGQQRLQLRHAPLLRRYVVEAGDRPPRQYAFRAAALAALEQPPPLALPRAAGWQVRVRLERTALPAPLRLPALLQPAWQADSGWQPAP